MCYSQIYSYLKTTADGKALQDVQQLGYEVFSHPLYTPRLFLADYYLRSEIIHDEMLLNEEQMVIKRVSILFRSKV